MNSFKLTQSEMEPPIIQNKTYFWVNQFNNKFPPEFIASKNKKYIVIEQCKAKYKDVLVGDVIMHADFIIRDHY